MHPAPSVILFTTLSGIGFGLLAFLGLGLPRGYRAGWPLLFLPLPICWRSADCWRRPFIWAIQNGH